MRFFFSILVSLVLLSSCGNARKQGEGKKAKTTRTTTSSAPFELLVVADKAWLKTAAGESLLEVVESPVMGLPQRESCFRVTKINPDALKGTFRGYANIVIADVSRKYKEKAVKITRDEYCHPQLIMYLEAPSSEDFIEMMTENKDLILTLFNEQEFARERSVLAKSYSPLLRKEAKAMFGFEMKGPKNLDDIKKGKDFLWVTSSKEENRLNICLYALLLKDYSLDGFAAARDSLMKINIPGEREDQWMETDARTISADSWESQDRKQKAVIVRGLWDMRNDAMGGPFVCYLYTDTINRRLVVAEGFVWCPQEKKRAMIRELEASLQTITHF